MDSYFCTWSYWICICRSSFQMQAGSRGLMDRVGLVTWRLRVRVSGQAGIVGRESECTALSSTILSKHRTPNYSPGAVAIWLPAAPGVCSLLCVHLDGLNAEHTFQVWVTILGHNYFTFTIYWRKNFSNYFEREVAAIIVARRRHHWEQRARGRRGRIFSTCIHLFGMPEEHIIRIYHLTSHVIFYLLQEIKHGLKPSTRSHAIPGPSNLTANLHFWPPVLFNILWLLYLRLS